MIQYAKPKTVHEALGLLAEDQWRILAGGTDFYPAQGAKPFRENVLDINGLVELRGIGQTATHHVIGARTTWSGIIKAQLTPPFDALKQAAREVGSVQIQNAGTAAGNLCNASPAADGVPPLLILDAEVELRSAQGSRWLPLSSFILGNRQTARQPAEMLTAIRVAKSAGIGRSAFWKLGSRRYLVISIAMAAARLELGADGRVADAAIAVGSCSAVAKRLPGLESSLIGLTGGSDIALTIAGADLSALAPIDDVRGTARYRLEAAREIVRRTVAAALASASTSARAA